MASEVSSLHSKRAADSAQCKPGCERVQQAFGFFIVLLLQIACLQDDLQAHKQKIDQMQVVMQEFETTVIEMAEKYEEDKAKIEKEKTEVTFVFFYFIYYVERKLYQCTLATRFGHLNSAFSRLFDLKSEKHRVATSWKSPGFFCCPGKSLNFIY